MRYQKPPLQEINHPVIDQAGLRLLVLREDLNHPFISGNKWWKLKYNIAAAVEGGYSAILTFGGAYSNHIYATAAAASEAGLQSIGIIRGEETLPLNPTLSFARARGMHTYYVSRTAYRRKDEREFLDALQKRFGNFHLIPEGGTNHLAIKGCAAWGTELLKQRWDHLLLPVGTGGTIAGLVCGTGDVRKITGIVVLKGGAFLKAQINQLVLEYAGNTPQNLKLILDAHHGGYAKTTPELNSFIAEMRSAYKLPLDHVYSAKLLWSIIDQARQGVFRRGETVLAVHTGGLQGAAPPEEVITP